MTIYEIWSLIIPAIVPTITVLMSFHKYNKKSEERRIKQDHMQEEHTKDIEEIKKTTKETHDQLFKKVNNHGERLSKLEGVVYGKGEIK